MTTRVSVVVALVSATTEFLRRVAAVIESDLLPSFYSQLTLAETSPPDVGFSLANDVVIRLGHFMTTDTARSAVSESREVIDYPELVRQRDAALRALYADYKTAGGTGVSGIVKRAADAQALSRKQTEELVRELWGIADKGSSLIFATYDPEPLPGKTKVPASAVVEVQIANTTPFSYDVRALFDTAMINKQFPTRATESIDKRAVQRYQKLITAHDVTFTEGTAPPSSSPSRDVIYRIAGELYRANVAKDDLDLVMDRANALAGKVIEDEILKFYHPSQLLRYERRVRNESKRQYTDAIISAFARHRGRPRPFLLALGDTFPERDAHTLASLLNFYAAHQRFDRLTADDLRRKLTAPNVNRQLSAIRGGDEEELFGEDGLYNLSLLD